MNERQLETLLKGTSLQVPEGFSERVMVGIDTLPAPSAAPAGGRNWLQWLALAGATVAGVAQIGAFMFGIWSAVSAG